MGVDAAEGVVFGVHHQQVALAVAADSFGRAPGGGQRRAAVAVIAALARPGVGAHHAVGRHHPDAVALSFADVGVAQRVAADRPRPQDGRLRRGPAVAPPFLASVPGKGGDDAVGQVQPADALVLHIGNQQPAPPVQKAVVGFQQHGVNAGAAVP